MPEMTKVADELTSSIRNDRIVCNGATRCLEDDQSTIGSVDDCIVSNQTLCACETDSIGPT